MPRATSGSIPRMSTASITHPTARGPRQPPGEARSSCGTPRPGANCGPKRSTRLRPTPSFSPDGKRLVSGGNDGRLQLVDAATGNVLATWERITDGRAAGIAWSADSRTVFRRLAPHREIWMPLPRASSEPSPAARARSTTPLSVLTAAGSPSAGLAARPRLSIGDSGAEIATLPSQSGGIYAVAYHPNGRILATGGGDRRIRLWELPSGRLAHARRAHRVGLLTRFLARREAPGLGVH